MKHLKNKIKKNIILSLVKLTGKRNILNYILSQEEKVALHHINSGYLYEIGWWNSWRTNSTIDFNKAPLPWVTYGFIDFIENRLNKDMELFEYGSGNSTLFYSMKVKQVYTVEHDLEWYNKIKAILPENVEIAFEELIYGGDYSRFSQKSGVKYDVIVIDGRDRVNCLINSLSSIKDDGIIILDDSERESYRKGVNILLKTGYKKLEFWGISPGLFYKKCTTIFYKSNNVLEI